MKKALLILSIFLISTAIISCTTLSEIPEDKTSAQILQMGQNAVSAGRYKDAEFCYNTIINRYGTNIAVYAEAKYELAHAYSKQKKYDKAYAIYTELIDLYSYNMGSFPAAYNKLCQIGIQNIPEKKLKELQEAKN